MVRMAYGKFAAFLPSVLFPVPTRLPAGVEHQILEVVDSSTEQMVYSHLLKIHRIVLLRVDCLLQLVELGIFSLPSPDPQNPAVTYHLFS